MRPRLALIVALAALVTCGGASAQDAPAVAGSGAAPDAPAKSGERAWSVSASAYTYILPDEANYVQPTVAGDRGWLHLEARFNYEDHGTGSAWFGGTFSTGERVTLEVTPMIGAVFGNTAGIAPGYELSLGWRALALYSEAEYVIDTADSADSFLYTWSELTVSPAEWYRFGLVVQRTKVYDTEFDSQRGLMAGVSWKHAEVTAHVFNPDASRPTVVVGLSLEY
jgi:hypothetical protein